MPREPEDNLGGDPLSRPTLESNLNEDTTRLRRPLTELDPNQRLNSATGEDNFNYANILHQSPPQPLHPTSSENRPRRRTGPKHKCFNEPGRHRRKHPEQSNSLQPGTNRPPETNTEEMEALLKEIDSVRSQMSPHRVFDQDEQGYDPHTKPKSRPKEKCRFGPRKARQLIQEDPPTRNTDAMELTPLLQLPQSSQHEQVNQGPYPSPDRTTLLTSGPVIRTPFDGQK